MSVSESAKRINKLLEEYATLKANQIRNVFMTGDGQRHEVVPHKHIQKKINIVEEELEDAVKELKTALDKEGKIQD